MAPVQTPYKYGNGCKISVFGLFERAAKPPALLVSAGQRGRVLRTRIHRQALPVCTIALLALWSIVVIADDAVLSEHDFLGDMPEVLAATATRLPQSRTESSTAVTVIDREMIEASGVTDITDIFRLVPGYIVGHLNASIPAVTAHAIADQFARTMQVLVDGRSVYLGSFGGVAWSDLPLAIPDIERIEVVRGPAAATYGSNSFLGVINIITQHPAHEQGYRIRQIHGEDHLSQTYLRYGGSTADLDYRITLEARHEDGFDHVDDSYDVALVNSDMSWRASARDTFDFQFGYNNSTTGAGNIVEPAPSRDIDHYSHFQQLRWEHAASVDNKVEVKISNSFRKTVDDITATLFGISAVNKLGIRDERTDVEFQHTLAPSASVRAVWGMGTRRERARSRFWVGNDKKSRYVHRLFGHTEWHAAKKIVVNAGAMVENNSYTGTEVLPSLGMNYLFSPAHTFRLRVARANRLPSVFEEKADTQAFFGPVRDQVYLSSGDLDSETITAYEVGYVGQFPRQGILIDLKLYHEDIDDLISNTLIPVNDDVDGMALDFTQVDNVNIDGLETQVQWQPVERTRLIGSYAYADIDSNDRTENFSESGPTHSFSLMGIQKLPWAIEASMTYYQAGQMDWLFAGDEQGIIRRLDARVAKSWKTPAGKLTIYSVAQNFLDKYQDLKEENVADARLYVGVNLQSN